MARNPAKYDYDYSAALKVGIATAKDGSHVYTEDGVKYEAEELEHIASTGEITPRVHKVKKIFSGQIVAAEGRVAETEPAPLKGVTQWNSSSSPQQSFIS